MTQRDDRLYLGHMLDMAQKAQRFTAGVTREQFDNDEMMQHSLIDVLRTLGEAARQVSPATRELASDISWAQIVGMRHRLVHDYMDIDFDVIWQVVHEELRPPIEVLKRLLGTA